MDIESELQFLIDMVDCNTYNWPDNKSQYEKCSNLIQGRFNELGFDVELIQTSTGPVIMGYREGSNESAHVHFNGHYDVVPPVKGQKRSTLDSIDSSTKKIYGRGTSDMKGGIVAIWLSIKQMMNMNKCPNISFSFSPDEEIGGVVGTKMIIDRMKELLYEPTLIVVGDSSYPDILTGHGGALWVQVTCRVGPLKRFSDSDSPSAFMIAATIAPRIEKEIKERRLECVVGGDCSSHSATNIWPDEFSFSVDVRFTNTWRIDAVEDLIKDIIRKIGVEFNFKDVIEGVTTLRVNPCPETSLDNHDIISIVQEIIPKCKLGIGKGFSDLRLFREEFSCPSFILGPGEPPNAHISVEFIEVDAIIDCARAYIALMEGGR